MAVRLYPNSFLSTRSSKPWRSQKQCEFLQSSSDLDRLRSKCSSCVRNSCVTRYTSNLNDNLVLVGYRKRYLTVFKIRKRGWAVPLVSPDDGVAVNGNANTSTTSADDFDDLRVKLNKSLQDEDCCHGLVQSLHDAARFFELEIKERSSFETVSWFSTVWLGIDRNTWIKELAYQTAVFSLLQAASDISLRGDAREKDVNVFVHKSLIRLSAPLESLIRDKLSSKQPEAYEWFWSEKIPAAVTSFIKSFESDSQFPAASTFSQRCTVPGSGNANDASLLMLALTCIAATSKLGSAKVLCSQFFSMVPEITGRLMDMLVDLIPVSQAYDSIKGIGLHKEFLVHFGPRAASCRMKTDEDSEEVIFWVNLVQKQLQQAIDREKIWSRLTTSESIEVLEKDLAIFGFFIALGRSTQSFLMANGFDITNDSLADFIRYLVGGSVLYYSQLSSISSYQLYVEVVCEELEWIPFYPDNTGSLKQFNMPNGKHGGPPNAEAVAQALNVCSHWMRSFIKYSAWLQNPSNVKAAGFLSTGHKKLMECMKELRISKDGNSKKTIGSSETKITQKESDSFDKALEGVEEAVLRLESLLQELYVSSASSGKEHLKAACTDLEKIRKLKKEAEFLEASFRAKAASLEQGDDESDLRTDVSGQGQNKKSGTRNSNNKNNRLWSFFSRPVTSNPNPELGLESTENYLVQPSSDIGSTGLGSSEIQRFQLLRNELMELEKRVEKSACQSVFKQDTDGVDKIALNSDNAGDAQLVHIEKKTNIIDKSFSKLRETGTDVWQGTQLLVIDVAAAMGLIRRQLIGDELSAKEIKALKRTATDVASVVPIGILMLLPVTAVGHAAMLAAIKRYVPAMIPSTYAPDRLDLLRQLEKVKQTTNSEMDENEEEVA